MVKKPSIKLLKCISYFLGLDLSQQLREAGYLEREIEQIPLSNTELLNTAIALTVIFKSLPIADVKLILDLCVKIHTLPEDTKKEIKLILQ